MQLAPSDRDAQLWLGFLLVLQERFEEALPAYERACALDPKEPVLATHRAMAIWTVCLARDGRWLDFVEANRKGAEITGGHPIFRARQALGLRRAGKLAEAESLATDVRSGAAETLSSGIHLVLALATGDHEGARSCLEQAIEERQPMVLWYRIMGDLLPREEPWVRESMHKVWSQASTSS